MKKNIVIIGLISIIFLGCKKKDCIFHSYADGLPPVPENSEILSIKDLFKLYIVEFSDLDCDDSRLEQIMSHNNDTVKVYGHFMDDFTGVGQWLLYDSTETITVHNINNIDFSPNDTSLYIATCLLHIFQQGLYSAKISEEEMSNPSHLYNTRISLLLFDATEVNNKK